MQCAVGVSSTQAMLWDLARPGLNNLCSSKGAGPGLLRFTALKNMFFLIVMQLGPFAICSICWNFRK